MKVSSKELFKPNWGKRSGVIFFIPLLLITVPNTATARTIGSWTPKYEGVWYAIGSDTSPRLMKAFALKIDTANPNISLYASPGNGGSPYEFTRQTTPAFMSAHNLEVAFNTNFFLIDSPTYDTYTNARGVVISNGTVYSDAESSFAIQLLFTSDNVASFVTNATTQSSGIYTAVGTHVRNLINGAVSGDNTEVNSRTAIGLSKDGRFLIIVVVDGGQAGWSLGACRRTPCINS